MQIDHILQIALQKISTYPNKKVYLVGKHSFTMPLLKLLEEDPTAYIYPFEITTSFKRIIQESDFKEEYVYIDALYEESPLELPNELAKVIRKVNQFNTTRISLGVNTGCQSNNDSHDTFCFQSELTIALDKDVPFYHLRKDHQKFKEVYYTIPFEKSMSKELFFSLFPKKEETAYKGTYGHIGIIAGSYGMAGACNLNILGAKTLGASYIDVCCRHDIYPILASRNITQVFHPYGDQDYYNVLEPVCSSSKAICFGSGCTNIPNKEQILDVVLQNTSCPVVLDAEAIRLLQHNYYILRFIKQPIILTPHIGEFADLLNITIFELNQNKIELCKKFSKDYHVYIVLKGPSTIITTPDGNLYINESGNQGLAQAGSGDVLTGMITAMLSYKSDIFLALKMAVFIHGYIADTLASTHSMQNLNLLDYVSCMDRLFKENGF